MTETPILCPQCDHDIDAHDAGLSQQRCYPEGVSYCWCRLAPSEIARDLLREASAVAVLRHEAEMVAAGDVIYRRLSGRADREWCERVGLDALKAAAECERIAESAKVTVANMDAALDQYAVRAHLDPHVIDTPRGPVDLRTQRLTRDAKEADL